MSIWYIFIGFFVLANFACESQQAQIANNSNENGVPSMSNSLMNSKESERDENTNELIESFSDDSKIGVLHKNRVEVFNFKRAKGNIAQIKFYSLTKNKEWKLKQSFEYEKDALLECDVNI